MTRPIRTPRAMLDQARRNTAEALTEEQWQQQVVQLAGFYRWRHLHVRRTIGRGKRWTTSTNVVGWPDLLLWHEQQQRVVAAELKSERGPVRPEQLEVLASLEAAGIETYVWRPSDLDEVQRALSGKGR